MFRFDWLRLSDALAIAWTGLVVLVLAVPPLISETVALGDSWLSYSPALEASLRWQFGHLPHVDYHTPTGIAYWLNQGLAVEIVGLGAKTGLVANLLAAGPIALIGLFLVRPRMTALMTALLMTGVLALLLSLRPIGGGAGMLGDISAPERIGLAIFAVLLATFFLEPRTERRPMAAALESVVVAGLLVWLVYLDVYIAALAVVAGGMAMAFPSASRGLILEAMTFAGLATIGLGFLYANGVPYLADIKAATAAAPMPDMATLVQHLQTSLIPLGVVIGALALYVLLNRADKKMRTDTVAVTVALILISVLAMIRVDAGGLSLPFVILTVLAARAHRLRDREGDKTGRFLGTLSTYRVAHIPASLAAILLVGVAVGSDLLTLKAFVGVPNDTPAIRVCDDDGQAACSIWLIGNETPGGPLLPSPTIGASNDPGALAAFVDNAQSVEKHAATCAGNPTCLRRALHTELIGLLNLVIEPGDTPLLLGVTNPLPYYYGIEPPRAVLTRLAPGETVSLRHHPGAGRLFSDSSLLVIPKARGNPDFEPDLLRYYEGAIARMFVLAVETDAWSIYRKPTVK